MAFQERLCLPCRKIKHQIIKITFTALDIALLNEPVEIERPKTRKVLNLGFGQESLIKLIQKYFLHHLRCWVCHSKTSLRI